MGTLPSGETLRARIGGRWAITWATYLVMVVVTPATLGFRGVGQATDFLTLAAASAGAACAVLLLADLTVLRSRRQRPVAAAVVVGVGVATGLARALAVIGTASAIGVQLSSQAAVLIAGSVILCTLAIVGVALLRDAIDRHRRERAALLARLAALREISGERTELAEAINDAAYAEMMAAIDYARRGIEVPVGEMSVDDRLALADDIRRTVNEQLRPISHRLYAAGHRPEPAHLTGFRALAASLRRQPLFPLATALVMLAVSSTLAEYALGPPVAAVLVWASLSLVVFLGRRHEWARRHQMLLGLGGVALSAVAVVVALRLLEGETPIIQVALASALLFVAVTVVTSLMGALISDDAVNAQLAEEVDARELESLLVSRELARTSRDLAQYVHGTLQANLLATALAIEEAAAAGDDQSFARALAHARESLTGTQGPPEADPDLPSALQRVAGLWRGFVEMRVDVTDDLHGPMPAAVTADVARIVGEAVANARKHGSARQVRVRIARAPDGEHLDITVADDGAGPAGGVKGMGSAWLDFIAPGAWSLGPCPSGSGACLDVRLAVPAADSRLVNR